MMIYIFPVIVFLVSLYILIKGDREEIAIIAMFFSVIAILLIFNSASSKTIKQSDADKFMSNASDCEINYITSHLNKVINKELLNEAKSECQAIKDNKKLLRLN